MPGSMHEGGARGQNLGHLSTFAVYNVNVSFLSPYFLNK